MNAFLKKILLFLIPILIISYPLDNYFSSVLKDKDMWEYGVLKDIYNENINSDIIINGSSRAWVHFNSSLIEDSLNVSCYNLGIDGQNFHLQHLRYLEFRKYNKKPKLIIQELDAYSFSGKKSSYNLDQFIPYMLFNSEMQRKLNGFEKFKLIEFYIPLIRYYGEYNTIFENVDSTRIRIKGYKAMNLEWSKDFENAQKKIKKITLSFDTELIKQFDKFVANCKKEEINIILVITPEYIEGQKFSTNREEGMSIIRTIIKKYNIHLYDFSENPLCYQKKYFYNALHLNKEGSTIFSSEMVPIIRENLK